MKKVIKSFLALSMAAFALASCEDVPAPYEIPGSADNGGDTELPEGVYLDQSFTSSLGDFKSIGNNENIAWEIDYSSACITGYKDYGSGSKANQAGVTYLVSPEIDLTNAKEAHVEMTYALNYERADINTNNALLISKDYADDPTKATWVAIPYSTEGVNSSFDFVDVASNIPADFIGERCVWPCATPAPPRSLPHGKLNLWLSKKEKRRLSILAITLAITLAAIWVKANISMKPSPLLSVHSQ